MLIEEFASPVERAAELERTLTTELAAEAPTDDDDVKCDVCGSGAPLLSDARRKSDGPRKPLWAAKAAKPKTAPPDDGRLEIRGGVLEELPRSRRGDGAGSRRERRERRERRSRASRRRAGWKQHDVIASRRRHLRERPERGPSLGVREETIRGDARGHRAEPHSNAIGRRRRRLD